MFGSEKIIGRKNATMDYKNRISLPNFTYAEKDDKIIVLSQEDYFSLYSSNYIDNTFVSKKIETVEDFILQSKIYDDLSKYIVAELLVGSNCRISLSSFLIEEYRKVRSVILSGAVDHLNLYPTEEIAKKHIFMM